MAGLSKSSSSSPTPVSQPSKVDINGIVEEPGLTGDEKPADARLNEKTATAAGQGDATPNPYAHLQDHEAAILKRQVETPEVKYSFWHVYRYATKIDLLIIAVAGLCSCASGAAMPVMTVIFGGLQGVFQDYLVYQTITIDEFEGRMAQFVLYFVYLAVGTFFASYISTLGFMYTGEHITTNLRQQYLESCLRQNIGFFDKVGAGGVAVRITSDADQIQDGISEKVGLLLACLATLVTGYLIGFIISWKLTLIMSSVFVFLLINTAFWTAIVVKVTQPAMLLALNASTLAQEIFTGVRVAIAFGSQKNVVKKYDGHLKATQGYGFKTKVAIGIMLAVSMGAMHLTYGLGFWQGSTFLTRGEVSLDRMITALMSVMIGSFNVGSIGPYISAFTNATGIAARLMMVVDRQTATDATESEQGHKPAEVHGQIKVQDIKHIYPSRPEVTVLDGVSLDFEAGKVTALVGASGSGKSTILGILERFYDPVQGKVFLDGRDINTLNIGWLRRQIGIVGQEPVLFSGSILENIRHGLIGSPGEHLDYSAQRDLIIAAAKDANAHEFISQLALGYETDVGQRGLLLSGGQKQRIAIARAIVSDPKILLLDEATSALDIKSEGVVQAALDKASVGRTTITISHRLSTIRNAHKTVVMGHGKVVEQGTHEQLLEAKGAYYELSNIQRVDTSDEPLENEDDVKHEAMHDLSAAQKASKLQHPTSESRSSASITAPTAATLPAHGRTDVEEPFDYGVWALIKFVFSFGTQESPFLIIGILFSIICGLATPVQSVFFAKQLMTLSRIGVPGESAWEIQQSSNFWSLMFLMLGLITFIAHAIQSVAFGFASQAMIRRLTRETLRQLLHQDVSFYDLAKNSAGALTANLSLETMQASNMSGGNLGSLIISLSIVVGGISLSLAIGWKLALVCLSVVPLLVFCGFLRFYVIQKYTGRAARLYVDSATFAAEHIAAMRTVASLSLEGYIASKYKQMAGHQRTESLKSVSKSAALYAASQSALFLCLGLGFWYGSTLMASFEYDIFQFFVCLMSVIFGSQSAGSMLTFIPDLVKARNSSAYLKALFDRKPAIYTNDPTISQSLEHVHGKLELRNVHFRYPTRPEQPVLQGLSMTVQPGQYAAIVGSSGNGKSTIISLLERFYNPTAGQIDVDGVDIARIPIEEYRLHLALVSQEPALFQGTIRENITMGSKDGGDISEETLIEVCKDAAIYDFVSSLPQGFDTDIGSAGALLSGGQKQRIAIARAMVRQPRILLLDEATSALDSESEQAVQVALERVAKGRTTVTIAHRLSTIRNADVIYVIDQGLVAEAGSHRELMALNGLYAKLVKLQSIED